MGTTAAPPALASESQPNPATEGPGWHDYPTSKDELVKHAQGKNVDDDVLSALKNLPGKRYETPADVNKEVS